MQPVKEITNMKHHNTNETRIALLEQSINHVSETLIRIEKEIKSSNDNHSSDIRLFHDDLLKRIDKKLEKIDPKLEKMDQSLTRMNERLWTNFYWILGAMFTLSCTMGGILAKGFKWF